MTGWGEREGAAAGGPQGVIDREEGPLDTAQAGLESALEAATQFVRERPAAALLGALAVGWLVGKLASRR